MPFISTDTATFDAANNRYHFTIPENSASGTILGQVQFDGGEPGTTYFTILGADAAKVRIDEDGTIRLADGVTLDHEGNNGVTSLSIDISALFFGDDGGFDTGDTSGTTVTVTDIDEVPILSASLVAERFAENSPAGTVIATFTSNDDDGDATTYSLSGDYADLFEIVGNEVRLKVAYKFDFEVLGESIDITLTASSTGSSGTPQSDEHTFTINLMDVNDPLVFDPVTPLSIDENSGGGTSVGQVTARDGDGDPVTYNLGNHNDKFSIDSTTGAISVKDGAVLDYEAHENGQITLTINAAAKGSNGRESTASQDVTVQLDNVNEPVVWDQSPQTFAIDENSPAGTSVGTVTAKDGDNTPVTYSIYGQGADHFTIDKTTGVISVAEGAKLDFENESIYFLKVYAESPFEGESPTIDAQLLTIRLNDVNEPLIFVPQDVSFSIDENSGAGTPVGKVTAKDGDGDPVTYNLGSHNDKFVIDETTGAISVKDGAALDYEALKATKGQITLTINAAAKGPNGRESTASQDVTVQLDNVNEPVVWDQSPQTFAIDENSPAGTPVGTVTAKDGDNTPVTYSIYGQGADHFTIDKTTGVISVAEGAKLDFENESIYFLKVYAESPFEGESPTIDAQLLTIRLNDVNEPLIFVPQDVPFSIDENSGAGTPVGKVTARDDDGDPVTYNLGNHNDLFTIDKATGAISVKDGAVLDYEAHENGQITLTINAVAKGPNGRESTASQDVTVQLNNLDEVPILTATPVALPINEHAAEDTVVARFTARDPDGDPARVFVTGKYASLFTIVGNDLVVAKPDGLDFETLGESIDITLTATSRADGARPLLDSQTFTLRLTDIDEAPEFGADSYSFTANENTAPGVALGTVRAVDPDHDGAVTYSLSGTHADMFTINDDYELVLKTGKVLDYEVLRATNGLITLTVTATSSRDGAEQHDVAEIRLQVTDVDEAPIFYDADGQPITTQTVKVDENDAGAIITPLNAIDPDGDVPVRYFVMTHRDKFKIEDGQLRLNPGVALDYEALDDGRITVEVSATARQTGERPQVTRMDVTVEVNDIDGVGEPYVNDLTAVHTKISQHDLASILARATRVEGFEDNLDQLRFADGVTEIWYRQIDDARATGGKSTLVTAFNTTTDAQVHYAVLTGWTAPLTNGHLVDADILIKNSVIGTDGHEPYSKRLQGTNESDHIDGGDGDDWLYGGSGDDSLYGGDGDDRLYGGHGDDRLYGEDGNDWLMGGSGRDILTGGAGRDEFRFYGTAASVTRADVVTDFTQGQDKLDVGRNPVWYQAIDSNGDGVDDSTALYDNASGDGGIFAILQGFTGSLSSSDFHHHLWFVLPVAEVITPHADDPAGNPVTGFIRHAKVVDVGRFKSIWYRQEGDDTKLYTSPDGADDSLIAVLQGYDGVLNRHDFHYWDTMMVEALPDSASAADHGVALLNTAQAITGFGASARLSAPTGSDEVWVRHVGDDTLLTWFDADDGTANGGRITGFTVLTGYSGAITTSHLGSENILIRTSKIGRDDTGSDEEYIHGISGADHIDSGDGNDWFFGGNGNDRLYGEDGDDQLVGGDGDDRLYGGDGDDRLYGGNGRDIMTGGAGNDRFEFRATATSLDRADVITDFTQGQDKLYVVHQPVWYQAIDQDGDGVNDATVLYNNASGDGGIYTILQGFTDSLSKADFGNAIPWIVEPVAEVITKPADDPAGNPVTGFIRHAKVVDVGRFKSIWYRQEGDDTELYTSPDGADDSLIAVLQGYDGVLNRHDFRYWDTMMVEALPDSASAADPTMTLFSAAQTITGFGASARLSAPTGSDEVWVRHVGDDTLLTWFDAYPKGDGRITGFTVLTGYSGAVTAAHLGSENILIRTSKIGHDDNGSGTELINGASGDDHIDSRDGNDRLYGWNGDDRLYGGDGNDYLNGQYGDDRLYGGDGDDRLHGENGDDRLYGEDGNDALRGLHGRDIMTGGAGNDRFDVSDTAVSVTRADVITDFTRGEDKISIGYISYPNYRKQVWIKQLDADGDGDTDTVLYNNAQGNGGIYAILRDYTGALAAADFADWYNSRAIEDFTVLSVGARDVFDLTTEHSQTSQQDLPAILKLATRVEGFDGRGDQLKLADGVTEIWYRHIYDASATGGKSTLVTAFNGATNAEVHYAVLAGWTAPLTNGHLVDADILIRTSKIGRDDNGWERINGTSGADHIDGGDGNDRLYGNYGDDRLYGGFGDDWLYGHAGDDRLDGGDGNDYLYGGAGDDRLYGGDDKDRLHGGDGNDWLYGGGSYDYINGQDGDDRLYGGDGNDYLRGDTGDDWLYGGDGNDYLNGQNGSDLLFGGDGHDGLYGEDGDDRLYGEDGNDYLSGGAGRDILTGGTGNDRFGVSDTATSVTRADVITDFTRGEDKIHLGTNNIKKVWFKHLDADGDNDMDTVLYNNAQGNGGIYAILRDYTGDMAATDFGDYNGNSIEDFTVLSVDIA